METIVTLWRPPALAVSMGLALWLGAYNPRAQDVPRFRSGVELVELDVVVLDSHRRPVTGLTPADFTILEDGVTRPIETFAAINLPQFDNAAPSWMREAGGGVTTNQLERDGRLVVIMMDRSIPAGPPTLAAREIANAAIDALGPADLAAVVRTGGFSRDGASQGVTADRARLRAAVESMFTGLVSPPQMTDGGLVAGPPELNDTGDCPCGLCTLESITRIADMLATAGHRQKLLLFIGSAIVISDRAVKTTCGSVRQARDRAFRAIDRANLTVHAIDPTGLETLAKGFGLGRGAGNTVALNIERQGDLAVLPDYAGGRTIFNANQPETLVGELFDESRSYYVLGFQRKGDGRNNARHRLQVVVDRDDVIVRNRREYYSSRGGVARRDGRQDPLTAAVRSLLPLGSLPLELALAGTILGNGQPGVDLQLRIGTGPPSAARSDGALEQAVRDYDVLVAVFDERARRVAEARQKTEPTHSFRTNGGVEWISHFPIPPGRYEVRVAVKPVDDSRGASVYGYVDVPDPRSQDIVVSDLQFEVPRAATGLPGSNAVRPTLTARRVFAKQERVAALLKIHQAAGGSQAAVDVRMAVIDDRDRPVHEASQTLAPSDPSRKGLAEVRIDLPASSLASGRYLLRVAVSSGGVSLHRDATFSIQ